MTAPKPTAGARRKLPRKLRRTDQDVVYQIEWWVSVENQGGYWTPLILIDSRDWIADRPMAERRFRQCILTPRRLVAVERRVMEVTDV